MDVSASRCVETIRKAAPSSAERRTVYRAQEKFPSLEHCVLITRCDPSWKVSSGSMFKRLMGFPFPLALQASARFETCLMLCIRARHDDEDGFPPVDGSGHVPSRFALWTARWFPPQ